MTKSKPIIKWAGGKTQILDKVFEKFPTEINNYYEPFIGGGSVFLELLNRCENNKIQLVGTCYLNDKNKELINMYQVVQNHIELLIKQLEKIKLIYFEAPMIEYKPRYKYQVDLNKDISEYIKLGKSYVYYYYRAIYNNLNININNLNDRIISAALLIFLNKTCFRGIYREGPNGFNVPFGNYLEPSIFNPEELKRLNLLLNKYKITFTNNDFNYYCLNINSSNDFVYLDPPYYPLKETSFVGYKVDGFSIDDHNNLLSLCQHLDSKNIKFLQSNSYCDFNVEKYNAFNQEKILCKRRINSKNPKDTDNEILINN